MNPIQPRCSNYRCTVFVYSGLYNKVRDSTAFVDGRLNLSCGLEPEQDRSMSLISRKMTKLQWKLGRWSRVLGRISERSIISLTPWWRDEGAGGCHLLPPVTTTEHPSPSFMQSADLSLHDKRCQPFSHSCYSFVRYVSELLDQNDHLLSVTSLHVILPATY